MLGRCARQVRRLLIRYREDGIEGIISRKRGRPSNNRLPDSLVDRALEIYREHLWDYGPSLAAEALERDYGIKISREKLRQVLIEEGLWEVGRKPSERVHSRRPREDCIGTLIQIDGSTHAWLNGKEECCLLVFIDDSTSRLMHLHLTKSETSSAYLAQWKTYLEKHGRPVKVYGDGHAALFRRSWRADLSREEAFTSDLARALLELGIGRELSLTPQGRGRVERVHRTLQDHLPKFLRRRGASTIEEANALLPEFMALHNQRFSVRPRSDIDRHRPLPAHCDLDLILSEQDQRKLTRALTVQHNRKTLVLFDCAGARAAIGHTITVHRHTDGRITLRFANKTLQHWIVDDYDVQAIRRRSADIRPTNQRRLN